MNELKKKISFFIKEIPADLRWWVLMWNSMTYLLLVFLTAIVLLDVPLDWPPRVIPRPLGWEYRTVGFLGAILWGSWYWWFVVDFKRWVGREGYRALSFLGAIVLAFGMSWIHPAYIFLLFGLFGVITGVLPKRWAIPLVLSLPVFLAVRIVFKSTLNLNTLATIAWLIIYSLMIVAFGLWINTILQQSRERQKIIDQLTAARGELAQKERQAGILEERQRLAAAIHDTLAQDFTSIVMHLEAAEQVLANDAGAFTQHLQQARITAREGLAETRRFVWALQPEVEQREPLPQTLSRVVEHWQTGSGISAKFTCEGEVHPLPAPVQVLLLRTAQEGLANIIKHSQAKQVNMTLTYMKDEVLLDVQDNGRGFDLAQAFHAGAEGSGYGLFSLRERTRELGGRFEVESEAGQGTTLVIQLPLVFGTSEAPARREHDGANSFNHCG